MTGSQTEAGSATAPGSAPTTPAGTCAGAPSRSHHRHRTPDRGGALAYMPALDGIRAFAVAAVIAFHMGEGWARGGYLGVDVFFVLSGYLITELLLTESSASGRISLGGFWGRRARRLLPGLGAMLAALALFARLYPGAINTRRLVTDGLATILYSQNWHLLLAHTSAYFAQLQAPSPLTHTWSLAIEEQFYLIWPLVLWTVLVRRHRRAQHARAESPQPVMRRKRLVALSACIAVASGCTMALASVAGASINALYYGTEMRAFELAIGATLAGIVALTRQREARDPRHPRHPRDPRHPHLLQMMGNGAALLILVTIAIAGGPPTWIFRGGLFGFSILTALVIAHVRRPGSTLLHRILSVSPVRYLGRISYGLYLWHWPVIVVLTPAFVHLHGAFLAIVQLAAMLGVSAASFHLIESPLRHANYRGLPRRACVIAGAGVVTALVATAVPPVGPTAASARPPGFVSGLGAGNGARPSGPTLGGVPPVVLASPVGTLNALDLVFASSRRPIRAIYVGDSVIYQESIAMDAALGATGVVKTVGNVTYSGWGLTTGQEWQYVPFAVTKSHANLMIASWVMDDTWIAAHDEAAFRSLMDAFVTANLRSAATPFGVAGIVFYGQAPLPSPDSPAAQYNFPGWSPEGRRIWSSVAAAEAAAHPGQVVYLPLAPALENGGAYSTWLPDATGRWVRVRQLDGVHVCASGAARYAAALEAQLGALLHLPPARGAWWEGSWSTDGRFDHILHTQPPGQCPDDHPPA